MSGTSGPTSRTPFAYYDPEASCWRTSQATFLSDSDQFSETWPRSGMTHAGFAYELPMPVLPTTEPESSSLLPTPAVNDMGAAYTPETWDAWTARMQEKHSNGNGHGKSLEMEAQRLLGTPQCADGMHQPMRTAVEDPHGRLEDRIAILTGVSTPTPSGDGKRVLGRPAPVPTDGGRLNPRFVEWMMGLPAGHVTDVPGLSVKAQRKALGNGVVPQQAMLAFTLLTATAAEAAA